MDNNKLGLLINQAKLLAAHIGNVIGIIDKVYYAEILILTEFIKDIKLFELDLDNLKTENYICKFDLRRRIWLENIVKFENLDPLPIGHKKATVCFVVSVIAKDLFYKVDSFKQYLSNIEYLEFLTYLDLVSNYLKNLGIQINKDLNFNNVYY